MARGVQFTALEARYGVGFWVPVGFHSSQGIVAHVDPCPLLADLVHVQMVPTMKDEHALNLLSRLLELGRLAAASAGIRVLHV